MTTPFKILIYSNFSKLQNIIFFSRLKCLLCKNVSWNILKKKFSDWTTNKFDPRSWGLFCVTWRICWSPSKQMWSLLMSLEDIHLYTSLLMESEMESSTSDSPKQVSFNASHYNFLRWGTVCFQGQNAYLQDMNYDEISTFSKERSIIKIWPANYTSLIIDGFISFLSCFEFQAKECRWKNFLQAPEENKK